MRLRLAMAWAVVESLGLLVLAIAAAALVAVVVFVFVLGDSDELTLPVCSAAPHTSQCWDVGTDRTLIISTGDLSLTDPRSGETPRKLSREQALAELNAN